MIGAMYSFAEGPGIDCYTFISSGPKGAVTKRVRFAHVKNIPQPVYNLGFGDWDAGLSWVNDTVTTNNGDRQKVLHTVAGIVLHFLHANPHAVILVKGSSAARNRLYQMALGPVLNALSTQFILLGYNGRWEAFKTGTNYAAFLLKCK